MSADSDKIKGHAKQAIGEVTDDKDLEREGKVDQGKAEVKEKVGNAADKVGDKIKDITD